MTLFDGRKISSNEIQWNQSIEKATFDALEVRKGLYSTGTQYPSDDIRRTQRTHIFRVLLHLYKINHQNEVRNIIESSL